MGQNKNTSQCPNSSKKKKRIFSNHLELINPFVAGIDIGSKSHFVAAPNAAGEICVREYSCFTPDLLDLVSWLKECKITSVAMESTGVYWIPLYDLLEEHGFDVKLADARKVKNVSGRKTDVLDCQWIQQLHAYGLLHGAFRPREDILPLRTYMRQRATLIEKAATEIQHMQKAMTQMNLQLANVLADVTGSTGMQIIRSIVAGERDPKALAKFRDRRCKSPIEKIEKSLTGYYREEHLFSLKQALDGYDFYQRLIQECDGEIEKALCQLNPQPLIEEDGVAKLDSKQEQEEPKKGYRVGGNRFNFNASEHIKGLCKVDLTKIPGISENLALKILGEIGVDPTRWKSEKQFSSWLGLSPENKVSGGKRISSRTKPTANVAAGAFRMAAMTIARTSTALGSFYRRIKARHGAAKAITATAHKIATIVYSMLVKGTEYVEVGLAYYEEQYKQRVLKGLNKKAAELGYALMPIIDPKSRNDNLCTA